jgi:hypothetical protein
MSSLYTSSFKGCVVVHLFVTLSAVQYTALARRTYIVTNGGKIDQNFVSSLLFIIFCKLECVGQYFAFVANL